MDEQGWWLALLEVSLQGSGLSEREVEERLGWEPGALGRMLEGGADSGPMQLLTVLSELGSEKAGAPSPPERQERGTQMVQELIDRFQGLGYGSPGTAPAVPMPSAGEIEKTVEDVLQRTFGGPGRGRRGGG